MHQQDSDSSSSSDEYLIQIQQNQRLLIEQTIANSSQRIGTIGSFLFDLDKVKPLLKDKNISDLFSTQRIFRNSSGKRIQIVVPRKFFYTIQTHTGKNFKPSKQKLYRPPSQSFTDVPVTILISHINFTNLIVLNLSKQNLTSVEPLASLNAPNLYCLELYGNHIYSMEPLVKAKFTQLQILTFYHNPIAKIEKFYRIENKKLNQYEFDNNKKAKILMEDYRFMFKIENRNFKKLTVRDSGRINLKGRGIYKTLNQLGTEIIFNVARQMVFGRQLMIRD